MKFYSFDWQAEKLFVLNDKGERKPSPTKTVLVGLSDEKTQVEDPDESLKWIRLFTPYFAKALGGQKVSHSPSPSEFDHIGMSLDENLTAAQTKLADIISQTEQELGSIRLSTIIAWHDALDDRLSEHPILARLRIEATEGERRRILNLVKPEGKLAGLTFKDPISLAKEITALF